MNQVGHLQKLHEKYFDKGLRIIAISKEPTGTLEGAVVKGKGATYWMASDPGGSTMGRYTQPGRLGIPHAYLIDAGGNVVGEGVPNEQRIEELLEKAFNPALGKELHKSLKPSVKLYEKGSYGKAWASAARATQNEDRSISSDAEYLRKRCEEIAKWRQDLVESGIKAKDYPTVYADLKAIPKTFDGMEIVLWARGKISELDQDEAVQTEMKAYKALTKAQKKQESAKGKAKKMGPARKAYKSIVKKYPGTRAAKMAEDALKSLPK